MILLVVLGEDGVDGVDGYGATSPDWTGVLLGTLVAKRTSFHGYSTCIRRVGSFVA